MIKGVLVGKDFGRQLDAKKILINKINELKGLYNIEAYSYFFESNKLKFKRIYI